MRTIAAATLILLANSASSESFFDKLERIYVGGGVNFVDAGGSGQDLNFTTLELHGGYKYNGFLGAEARVGFGITEEEVADGAALAESTLEYHAAVYWRPETANEVAKIYGLLGYSTVGVNLEQSDGSSTTNTDSGLSYGGGVGFAFEENWHLNFEYRLILDNDSNEFSAYSANVNYRF